MHFAGRNLFFAGSVITKLADAQTLLRPHRRPEDATGHRPESIQIAHACLRIEHWTRLVIGELREMLFGFGRLTEYSCTRVAGKIGRNVRKGNLYAIEHSRRPLRIGLFERLKPGTQTLCIELADGKYANTALRASRMAHKPCAAALRSIGQRGIYDLYEFPITLWQHNSSIITNYVCRADIPSI